MTQFRLKNTIVRRCSIDAVASIPDDFTEDRIFHAPLWTDPIDCEFAVLFRLQLLLKPEAFCEIEFLAIFATKDPIDDEFRESHFPEVNAPAIAYPYLRAFVSQLCVISGYENKILGVQNFVKKREESQAPTLSDTQK